MGKFSRFRKLLKRVLLKCSSPPAASIKLIDITGREMYNETLTATEGENHLVIDVNRLSAGIYTIIFRMGDSNEQIRVVVE